MFPSEIYPDLPTSVDLDIYTFSRLLDETTNSYKFLFLLSILDLLASQDFSEDLPIQIKSLAIEMLVKSWCPYLVFKLSFGWKDAITSSLDSLGCELSKDIKASMTDDSKIRDIVNTFEVDNRLTKYVPFRLIRPFFPELRGYQDHKVNQEIKQLSNQLFDSRKPLYKINDNLTEIFVHPEWCTYMRSNFGIVRGWIAWKWLLYMQRKNPNIPAIANKLFPQRDRQSLQKQTKYWKKVVETCPELRCIYSGGRLSLDDLSLDHYLPWSFVAHDQLWNLIPVPKSINSSKSNKIPDDRYFDSLIRVQHLGLKTFCNNYSQKVWERYIEDYWVDLGLSNINDLLNIECLRSRYELKVKPLIALAAGQGFECGWQFT